LSGLLSPVVAVARRVGCCAAAAGTTAASFFAAAAVLRSFDAAASSSAWSIKASASFFWRDITPTWVLMFLGRLHIRKKGLLNLFLICDPKKCCVFFGNNKNYSTTKNKKKKKRICLCFSFYSKK
jgi:hypothetical protein